MSGEVPYQPPSGYHRSVLYTSPVGPVVLICQRCGALVSERADLHDAWHRAASENAEART